MTVTEYVRELLSFLNLGDQPARHLFAELYFIHSEEFSQHQISYFHNTQDMVYITGFCQKVAASETIDQTCDTDLHVMSTINVKIVQ